MSDLEYPPEEQHCIKTIVQKVFLKISHECKTNLSHNIYLSFCSLLAPPSGALVVSQFQDPIQSSPTYRFGCSNLL